MQDEAATRSNNLLRIALLCRVTRQRACRVAACIVHDNRDSIPDGPVTKLAGS